MDYNYIRLENQIKALMNKNYSSTSAVSQIAQQLQVGNYQLFIDTVNKQFVFKYHSINNPIGIDPINNKIINVKYINDVDISKLIGGLTAGDGIVVEDIGNGVFKISVEEGKYATPDELKKIDERFDDYTTTTDIQATYATKDEMKAIDDKFDGYSLTTDIQATYATKDEMKAIDERFDDYTTTTDLESTYLKKADLPSTDLQFTVDNGFPYFTVKNEHVSVSVEDSNINVNYNVLKINVPEEIKTKILDSTFKKLVDVFKFIIRKQYVFKYDGTLTTEFTAYVNNGTIFNPIITNNASNGTCNINNEPNTDNEFYIAFDTKLPFNPYELYMNGELSVMYCLSQDALVSTLPTIRCDTIEAKNVLKLHESDVHYFYKPSIINEETIGYTHRVINQETAKYEDITDQIDCYKMIYKIPDDYEIPSQLNFKFVEHCFGNQWSLYWDGTKWTGDNVQGRSNGKTESSKQYLRVDEKYNDYGMSGCWIRCKHDEWNARFLESPSSNYMKDLFSYGYTYLLYKDGTIEKASQYRMDIDRYPATVEPYSEDGYDYLPVYLRINNNDEDAVNQLLNRGEKNCYDMKINDTLNRLTFR